MSFACVHLVMTLEENLPPRLIDFLVRNSKTSFLRTVCVIISDLFFVYIGFFTEPVTLCMLSGGGVTGLSKLLAERLKAEELVRIFSQCLQKFGWW